MTVLGIGLLIAGGLIFLALEFFIVPGFSIPGIAGLGMLGYGLWVAGNHYGARGAILVLVISATAAGLIVRSAFRFGTLRVFGLDTTQAGNHAGTDYTPLRGKTGTALSDLRPSGLALIDGARYDVVTEGDFIDEGSTIVVSTIDGARIVVSLLSQEDQWTSTSS